ncbi:MAG: gamma-butyrobetaine,2-oxoglutarate dioxygenase [Hellea sp.]|nr:gamma-butyrobetaine,2-oxoglutarate dioxygenase [Hellea sp.]
MTAISGKVSTDSASGGIRLGGKVLHPLWLRERVTEAHALDSISHQRLYQTAELDPDLMVENVLISENRKQLSLQFSDGYQAELNLAEIAIELGLAQNPESIPLPKSWQSSLEFKRFSWNDLDDPNEMKALLTAYFENAFCIMDGTPTDQDSLKQHARRFGFLRATNFGELFNVETKPAATDLAYTDAALASHTDNPYRWPVPSIQYLHCIANGVEGGLSTLVDGMAVANTIAEENQDWADILESTPVRFRYDGPTGIYEDTAPLIARDYRGYVNHIRFSPRLDFVPALDPETLTIFYAARRRMHELANDLAFQIQFPFKPGTLLMMNNYRLFHGRTAFNGKQGYRHLQGCYIDHDGPQCLYRMLAIGNTDTHVRRET